VEGYLIGSARITGLLGQALVEDRKEMKAIVEM